MTLHFVSHAEYTTGLDGATGFPADKYARVARLLRASGVALTEHRPTELDPGWAAVAHDPNYVEDVLMARVSPERERRIGFRVSPQVARRALLAAEGTHVAARLALDHGYAANGAGGSHHAGPDGGAGYCVLNDLAITAMRLLAEGTISRLAIIDLDVHQGDGTARILRGIPDAFTMSLHAEKNFPARKAESDLDVALPDATGDDAYLTTLHSALRVMFERARPRLLLYQAGVDPHRNDRLGRLALTDAGLVERDRMVMHAARAHGVPVTSVLGGGYGDPEAVARRHTGTILTLYAASEGCGALAA